MAIQATGQATGAGAPRAQRRGQRAAAWAAARIADPRFGQILALSALVSAGVFLLGFDIHPAHPLLAVAGALGAQAAACAILKLRFDPLSPAITALSLSILFRTDTLALILLAAAIGVGSKFVFRWAGRHFFNPAAFALVALPLIAPILGAAAWVSPGQWGALGLWAVLVAGIGATVAGRAARLDTTLAFLLTWAALLFGRAAYVGDPLAIPLWQIQSGAVLVFAFHMISDPATTPRGRPQRLAHAAFVALLGFWLQRAWITDIGPILALVLAAPLVPLLDHPKIADLMQRGTKRRCRPNPEPARRDAAEPA